MKSISAKVVLLLPSAKRWTKDTWRAQYGRELYAAFGKDESPLNSKKRSLVILHFDEILNSVGAIIHFTGEVSGSNPGWPSFAKGNREKHLVSSRILYLCQAQGI